MPVFDCKFLFLRLVREQAERFQSQQIDRLALLLALGCEHRLLNGFPFELLRAPIFDQPHCISCFRVIRELLCRLMVLLRTEAVTGKGDVNVLLVFEQYSDRGCPQLNRAGSPRPSFGMDVSLSRKCFLLARDTHLSPTSTQKSWSLLATSMCLAWLPTLCTCTCVPREAFTAWTMMLFRQRATLRSLLVRDAALFALASRRPSATRCATSFSQLSGRDLCPRDCQYAGLLGLLTWFAHADMERGSERRPTLESRRVFAVRRPRSSIWSDAAEGPRARRSVRVTPCFVPKLHVHVHVHVHVACRKDMVAQMVRDSDGSCVPPF